MSDSGPDAPVRRLPRIGCGSDPHPLTSPFTGVPSASFSGLPIGVTISRRQSIPSAASTVAERSATVTGSAGVRDSPYGSVSPIARPATMLLHGLTLPLHLLKVAVPPRDAIWLLTPLFVVLILPGRPAVGWAAVAAYLAVLFLAPVFDALGTSVLFGHHAVLLPTPFR